MLTLEADQQESFWGCQVVHSFDEPKMFWQFVRIADKKMPSFTVRRLEQMRFLLIQLTIYFLLNKLKTFSIGKLFVLRKQSYIKDPVGNPNTFIFYFSAFHSVQPSSLHH